MTQEDARALALEERVQADRRAVDEEPDARASSGTNCLEPFEDALGRVGRRREHLAGGRALPAASSTTTKSVNVPPMSIATRYGLTTVTSVVNVALTTVS